MWVIVGALGALAVLAMLRVLACHREHQIAEHDFVCQVHQMRNDYLRQQELKKQQTKS